MRVRTVICLLVGVLPVTASRAQEPVTAYVIPAGTAGNQDFGGSLGMDFDVVFDILVTRLGVFDDNSDGLNLPITARLYDRFALEELASIEFTADDPGELIGGSRFKDLDEPIDLPAGFEGTIVAEGYGAAERNGNQGGVDLGLTTDSGGCMVSFVGNGRFGATAGLFPDTVDGGPVNRYAAGTFVFEPLEDPPPPVAGTAYIVPDLAIGNDAFGGPLGMDFDVNVDLLVTSLGVFDSGSDGLATTITARLWDRDSRIELASLEFTPDEPGELVGGSRFKELPESLGLPAGTRCTIVAEGYDDNEMNGNQTIFPIDGLETDTGGCAIEFVGRGRTGVVPGEYPATVLIAAPNSPNPFAAGTFEFEPSDMPFERPGVPGDLQAVAEEGRVRLSWTPPAGGPAVAGYNVYQTRPGALARVNPVLVTATSFTVAGLLGGVEHCFVVRAALASGIEGASSGEACATPPPVGGLPEETTVAYIVPEGTIGNQSFGGSLGLDFDVNFPITVTRLGVFDSGSDGLALPITARLYDRDLQTELVSIAFTPEEPGELIDGSRFSDLEVPIGLPTGFRGSIVGEGYGVEEMNGNATVGPLGGLSTDNLGCAISFVGSRFGGAGTFPLTFQNAPVINPFAAGTFVYGLTGEAPPEEPPGGTAYVIAEGVVGNQAFGGALGMDFNVEGDLLVTSLGVFDDGSDGLNLPINARLYDRDNQSVLASLDFTPEDPGELVGGSRFKELDEPVGLPAGFRGTMTASGYGGGELNGNQGGGLIPGMSTDDGGCLVTFVGGGRFGDAGTPGIFPNVVDGGPVNRYAAGTFTFEPSDEPIVLPPGPPQAVQIIARDGEILLTWVAPAGATPAVRYRVFRAAPGDAFAEVADVEQTEYRDTDVVNGEELCYRVRSVAEDGQESTDSPASCATPGALVEGRFIAYQVPGATPGTGPSADAFGLDFDVNLDIRVTRFGVFDAGSDGLSDDLVVRLYDRETQEEIAIVEFSGADPGVLIGGSRFKDVDGGLELPAGFLGSIVAEGFTDADPVRIGANFPTDPGPCSLTFVGSRRDLAGFFPLVAAPAVYPFACATFEFEPLEQLEPGDGGIAYINPEGTFGNQDFPGALGMDFNVQAAIRVTRLGVFDDGSDGLFLPLNARLYDRDTREVLARLDFTPEDPGDLVDGSRFKDLDAPISLPPGFHGTIVGQGYGATERNGNQGAFDLGLVTDDSGCLITFVGGGRFGAPGGGDIFPDTPDGGPVNRYAAGTFVYERTTIEEGILLLRGDANNDTLVNISDPSYTLNNLFVGGPDHDCQAQADSNGDGRVNISDPSWTLNFLFLGGPSPPEPFPACGRSQDPRDLTLGCGETMCQ